MSRFCFPFFVSVVWSCFGLLQAQAQTPQATTEVTAIDVLLAPDDVMIEHAKAANARLRENYPKGFALDATHAPHITIIQRFVRTGDLDKVYAAVAKVLKDENPTSWPLKATGYYDIPIGNVGVAGIVIEPTQEQIRLQQKVIDAVAPYTADKGTEAAFVPKPDGGALSPGLVEYVSTFVPKSTGKNYNPHVTVGVGTRDYLDKLKAEPFQSFAFKPRAVAVYQLGDYGTAQKLLWTSAPADPLPSWNDGPTKKSITDFVARVTKEGGPDFVPVAERIATFDNDGTLWVEQPMYTQLAFALDRVKALAPDHPEWKDKEPFASLLKGDVKAALAGGERAIAEIVMVTHAGMTTQEFEQIVSAWIKTARHPRFDQPYTSMVYQPMVELLAYLRANGFKTFIVSGGGIEFMRPWTERTYGVPPEQVVGSSIKTKYEMRDGKPVLMRLPEINFIDDHAGKPIGINSHIGRRPIAAFGNSDGDREMLEWTQAGKGARLMMLVHHDDATREWAYGPESKIGTFSDSLMVEAKKNNWSVISMKNDWKRIFPFDASPLTRPK